MNFKFHKFSSVIGGIPLLANPLERSSTVLTYSNAAGIQGALVLGRRVLVESDVAEFTNALLGNGNSNGDTCVPMIYGGVSYDGCTEESTSGW